MSFNEINIYQVSCERIEFIRYYKSGFYNLAQMVKTIPSMYESRVWSLGWEDPLEKGMATHSSIPAWRIPRTKEPWRLQSLGSQRVGCNRATNKHLWKVSHSVMSDSLGPMDCSLPGSSVHEIFQARILKWEPFPSPSDLPNPGI